MYFSFSDFTEELVTLLPQTEDCFLLALIVLLEPFHAQVLEQAPSLTGAQKNKDPQNGGQKTGCQTEKEGIVVQLVKEGKENRHGR